jgi:hypothetical protein
MHTISIATSEAEIDLPFLISFVIAKNTNTMSKIPAT